MGPNSRRWIEWQAARMDDPVRRLRYLRTSAPTLEPATRRPWTRRLPLLMVLMLMPASWFLVRARVQVQPLPNLTRRIQPPAIRSEGLPDVWQVERGRESEIYSNGLRIDTRFAVATHPRSYHVFSVERPADPPEGHHTAPAGIVFHTTESMQAPFEAEKNGVLKLASQSLVEYVRRHHSYNYLVDRFGRVYRIVNEDDVAEHAGFSIWSDRQWHYINLNESFLGVSFEARTIPGQAEAGISPAQIRAGAMLIEMLRSRHGIPSGNCVTHAQVSVNPANMRVGFHTDWASSFPFEQLGLPNNYPQPSASIATFGFEYDEQFLATAGQRLFEGVQAAEDIVRVQAQRQGVSAPVFRKMLQKMYRQRLSVVHRSPTPAEGS